MLEADGIQYTRKGRAILNRIYIAAKENEVTGIVGSNGCGKSTLMQIMFGSLKAEYASIRLNGVKLKSPYSEKNLINYLPQFTGLPKGIKVTTVCKLYNVSFTDLKQYFENIKIQENQTIGSLSKGTQRLLELYVYLSTENKVILLDEPFSYIMPLHIEKIKTLIRQKAKDKIIILTDHMYQHIHSLCQKIYLIKNAATIEVNDEDDLIRLGYLPDTFR